MGNSINWVDAIRKSKTKQDTLCKRVEELLDIKISRIDIDNYSAHCQNSKKKISPTKFYQKVLFKLQKKLSESVFDKVSFKDTQRILKIIENDPVHNADVQSLPTLEKNNLSLKHIELFSKLEVFTDTSCNNNFSSCGSNEWNSANYFESLPLGVASA